MNRKTFQTVSLVALAAVAFAIAFNFSDFASAQSRPKLAKADIDRMMTELSNWGRWGKDDQFGALNLITAAKRKQAAALVTEGASVSLARETNTEREPDNPNPYQHTMNLTGAAAGGQWSVDTFSILFHGYQHTHMDALCHIFYQGKMFNGFSQQEVTAKGAQKLAITNLKQGIFTRGVLMDMAALKGVAYLEPGEAVYSEDLDAWEKKA
ncbi:MAG: cyclase family protein, partial [Blastocatellia bacterium]